MTHLALDELIACVFVSVIYEVVSFDIILSILWTRYADALVKLKIQDTSFYAAKTTDLLAQPS